MDKISIIIPVYNVEPYLKRCMDTVLNQTHHNLEVLLIDDGSTDQSGVICDEYAKQDARVVVIHKENSGVSKTRNVGLEKVSGKFIGFVDADDYIEADMYEVLYQGILQKNADIAVCGYFEEYVDRTELRCIGADIQCFNQKQACAEFFRRAGCIGSGTWNKLYSRDVLRQVKYRNFVMGEDVEFAFRALQLCKRLVCVNKPEYHYVHRAESATALRFRIENMHIITVADEMIVYTKEHMPDLLPQAYAYQLSWYIATLQVMVRPGNARLCKQEKKLLRSKLKLNIKHYLLNPYAYYVDQFLLLAHLWHCFPPVYILYKCSMNLYHKIKKKQEV